MNAVTPIAAAEPAAIGHNEPPEQTPFEQLKDRIEDLLLESHNWADGTEVQDQAQADEASRLIEGLRKIAKEADELRVEEKRPLDEQIADIQARFNTYIADPKNKVPGKIWKAIDALKATVKPFLDKLEAERRATAEAARQAAEAAAAAAAKAVKSAKANDLNAIEEAGELIAAAEQADIAAKRVENTRTQARGGSRAMGLRTVYRPVIADRREALKHYLAQRPDDFVALLQTLAEQDVREGKRQIPGFNVVEETVL